MIAISNIAWPAGDKLRVYNELRQLGVAGIEVALTKFGAWEELTPDKLREERNIIADHGLAVLSFQALLFGRPNYRLFENELAFESMRSHFGLVARLAEALGGGPAVFGSPGNRRRGDLTPEAAFDLGARRFRILAETVGDYGLTLALEPAATAYGGDFLIDVIECASMVEIVAHPNFGLHLDTGCCLLAGHDAGHLTELSLPAFVHCHLSQPYLAPVGSGENKTDLDIVRWARRHGYGGPVVIEMRETADPLPIIRTACAYAAEVSTG